MVRLEVGAAFVTALAASMAGRAGVSKQLLRLGGLLRSVEAPRAGNLVRCDVMVGDVLAAELVGLSESAFESRLRHEQRLVEFEMVVLATVGPRFVVEQALAETFVDLVSEHRMRPDGDVGERRVVLLREAGIRHANGKRDWVLSVLTRGGGIPGEGGGADCISLATIAVRAVEFVDEDIGVEQREFE